MSMNKSWINFFSENQCLNGLSWTEWTAKWITLSVSKMVLRLWCLLSVNQDAEVFFYIFSCSFYMKYCSILYEIGYETNDMLFSPVTGLHVPSGVKYINIVSRLLCVCSWDWFHSLCLCSSLSFFLAFSQSQDCIQLNQYKLKSEIGKVSPPTSNSYCVILIVDKYI